MSGPEELFLPEWQSESDQQQQFRQWLMCPEHPLLEAAHQDNFVHVPVLGDAQSGSHTYCIQQENCQMHIQYNEMCIQIKAPAMCIHSYDRDNELLFCQWFQQALYLIQ